MNPYLTQEEVVQTFLSQIAVHLEENHTFTPEDLQKIATGFIMAAMPKIVQTERSMCIAFVRSLNSQVADALQEKRGHL
jgi:hypothetical protein